MKTVRPIIGTIKLDDMRVFAHVAESRSFTAAARILHVPKQTLSRRVAELEDALGVQLLQRTTRNITLTDVGATYAVRCADLARAADEANRAVTDDRSDPKGVLRITADPLFGDAFLTPLVLEYARAWPDVEIEVVLTRRRVELVEEGFDLAFRVGTVDDKRLTALNLGAARVRYCASDRYLRQHGTPKTALELAGHECLLVHTEGEPARWPMRAKGGIGLVTVKGRLRFSSFSMVYAAALAGLGIGLFPDFACEADLRKKRLNAIIEPAGLEVGAIWLVHPAQRFAPARVRTFAELVVLRLGCSAPWQSPRGE